jgi:hypothetical protein
MEGDESTTAFATGVGGFCWWLRLLFGLQFLSCLTAPVEALAEGAPRPAMHLVWIDVSQTAGFAFEPMAADVESLLGMVGVDVAWMRGEPRMSVTADTFRVIVQGSKARRPERRRPVMGSVMAKPSPPPTVWIGLPNVLAALGLQERASQTSLEKLDIGRALACVIVHELVHVVLPARPHSPSGLMAAQLGRDVLLWPGTEGDLHWRHRFWPAWPPGLYGSMSRWLLAHPRRRR